MRLVRDAGADIPRPKLKSVHKPYTIANAHLRVEGQPVGEFAQAFSEYWKAAS